MVDRGGAIAVYMTMTTRTRRDSGAGPVATAVEGQDEIVKLSDAATFLLEECRMVLPGIQALFGFQLVAVFNERFGRDLSDAEQALHYVATGLVSISVALIMTPAAYHRALGVRHVSARFLRNASRLLLASMLPLGLGTCIDFYLVGRLVVDAQWPAFVAAALFALFMFLWFAFPRSRRLHALLDRTPATGRD
jgi:hypothetical protein